MSIEFQSVDITTDNFGVIFDKLSHNDTELKTAVEGVGTEIWEETLTATEGQSVFSLSLGTYVPTKNTLEVYVDNIRQFKGTGYTETSSSSFTFSEPLEIGQVVRVRYYKIKFV